ncbi:MAG TPA: hypothetical protein VFY14_14900 [Streptomyces sp.]|nr:hypothetical protein [Streptomyces sp.]
MGWSFKLHAGIAAGLSAALLVAAALTLLPGLLWPNSPWLGAGTMLLAFSVCGAALLRGTLAGGGRRSVWSAFRRLPGAVQVVLVALFVTGLVLVAGSAAAGSRQPSGSGEGRYHVLDTDSHQPGLALLSHGEHEAAIESEQRYMFAVPGIMLAVTATLILVTGELRRR